MGFKAKADNFGFEPGVLESLRDAVQDVIDSGEEFVAFLDAHRNADQGPADAETDDTLNTLAQLTTHDTVRLSAMLVSLQKRMDAAVKKAAAGV